MGGEKSLGNFKFICGIIYIRLGVAQLVARDFWEVEAAGSSPVTQTIFMSTGCGAVGSAQRSGR